MKKLAIFLVLIFAVQLDLSAQSVECKTWNDSPQKEEGENQHSIYRPLVRNQDYERAFPHWQKAFNIAPAADGKRDYHYEEDRKSTRLNSSHVKISYAVFCLKKKKK